MPRDSGVVVADVDPDGPAHDAGLREGDILDTVDGHRIDILPDLTTALYRASDAHLKLRVLRDGKPVDLEVHGQENDHSLEEMADVANPDKHLVRALGIVALDIDDGLQERLHLRQPNGVVVVARTLDGPGVSSSLMPGVRDPCGQPQPDRVGGGLAARGEGAGTGECGGAADRAEREVSVSGV